MLTVDFAKDLDYLFVAQYIVEANQIFDNSNNFIWRQKPSRQHGDQPITARCMKNQASLSAKIKLIVS